MYEFVTHTWNPLIGKCLHECLYCSTNKFYYPTLKERYSGKIRLDLKCFNDNLGKGNFIFVCAQNDLFSEGVPDGIIYNVLDYCYKFDNKYLFQTKNPTRLQHFSFDSKTVFCTTIETNRIYPEIMNNCPTPQNRAYNMPIGNYVTIEPILDFDLKQMVGLIKQCSPIQVNIGADSGRNNLPEPSKDKVLELVSELQKFTTIHRKTNLARLL